MVRLESAGENDTRSYRSSKNDPDAKRTKEVEPRQLLPTFMRFP